MRITIKTVAYNDRREGKPWIAKVTSWGGGKPEIEWGDWHGRSGDAGLLEIHAQPGDILRHGQKDTRRPDKSENKWAIVQPDGTLVTTTEADAREYWVSRSQSVEAEPANPLLTYTDDQIMAEARRRGLVG